MNEDGDTRYGFRWGPMEVSRLYELQRPHGKICRVVEVRTGNKEIDIYVSPNGRSIRVFDGARELR